MSAFGLVRTCVPPTVARNQESKQAIKRQGRNHTQRRQVIARVNERIKRRSAALRRLIVMTTTSAAPAVRASGRPAAGQPVPGFVAADRASDVVGRQGRSVHRHHHYERADKPLGRPHIENGKRFAVPNSKIKWDRGNPTGHGIIFIGHGLEIHCYLPPAGKVCASRLLRDFPLLTKAHIFPAVRRSEQLGELILRWRFVIKSHWSANMLMSSRPSPPQNRVDISTRDLARRWRKRLDKSSEEIEAAVAKVHKAASVIKELQTKRA
jgi:hypothetical protein